MYYENIFRMLNQFKVRYLVAGGMAVNLYGLPRFTKDLDLLLDESEPNLERFGKAMKQLGFKPRVPVTLDSFLDKSNWPKWRKEKGMLAFTLFNPAVSFEEIDILIGLSVSYSRASKKRKMISAGDLRIPIVSIKDLINMKEKAGRKQDLSDVEGLKMIEKFKENK